jgi:hypothetical protein
MWGISCINERRLVSHEEPCSMDRVNNKYVLSKIPAVNVPIFTVSKIKKYTFLSAFFEVLEQLS